MRNKNQVISDIQQFGDTIAGSRLEPAWIDTSERRPTQGMDVSKTVFHPQHLRGILHNAQCPHDIIRKTDNQSMSQVPLKLMPLIELQTTAMIGYQTFHEA